MSLRRSIAVAFLTSVLAAVATAAGSDRYRFAGVLAVGPDFLGILELPGGDQMPVHKGSVVEGGGRVVLLDATRLHITFPGQPPLEITLDGSDAPAVVPPGLGVIQDQIDRDNVMIRSVDSEAMLAAGSNPSHHGEAVRCSPGNHGPGPCGRGRAPAGPHPQPPAELARHGNERAAGALGRPGAEADRAVA